MATDALIEQNFTYHKPTPEQIERMIVIRGAAKDMAYVLKENMPLSHEAAVAMERLNEVVMWANAGIAREVEGVRAA